jgi:hypothetical protein
MQIKWDIFIAHYWADCDYYARVRASEWEVEDNIRVCPDVKVKVTARLLCSKGNILMHSDLYSSVLDRHDNLTGWKSRHKCCYAAMSAHKYINNFCVSKHKLCFSLLLEYKSNLQHISADVCWLSC